MTTGAVATGVRPWLGVQPRYLAALEAVAVERSFRGAAERLGYGQPAVSQQISVLERLVGARLVERSRGQSGVALTEAGVVLLGHAERVMAALSAATADLHALTQSPGRRLRVGAFQSAAARIVPAVLVHLAGVHPEVRVQITEAPGDGELFDAVADGELDCAFAELPLAPGPFDAVELMADPCVLVVHRDWPPARGGQRPSLQEIARLPLASARGRMSESIDERLRAAGLHPSERFALQSDAAVQALVAAGLTAAIMPRLAVDVANPHTTAIDLDLLLPPRTLVLFWHRDRARGPAMNTFIDATLAICAQITRA